VNPPRTFLDGRVHPGAALFARGGAVRHGIQVEKPDIVLLDLDLPHVTGWYVAKQAAAEFGLSRPFVVAISGHPVSPDGEPGVDVHLMSRRTYSSCKRSWSTMTDSDFCRILNREFRGLQVGILGRLAIPDESGPLN
jgi:hypothetical protein